jgi:trehalose-6-phosphate synthase
LSPARNNNAGALGYHPVQYVYHSVDFNELCALYQVAEVALITSLRDGMNLVVRRTLCLALLPCARSCSAKAAPHTTGWNVAQALEYISCQEKTHGVLILSEFAGVRSRHFLTEFRDCS